MIAFALFLSLVLVFLQAEKAFVAESITALEGMGDSVIALRCSMAVDLVYANGGELKGFEEDCTGRGHYIWAGDSRAFTIGEVRVTGFRGKANEVEVEKHYE